MSRAFRRRAPWALALALCPAAQAFWITSHYSPRNSERPPRRRTDFIILHTTEAPKESSLNKLRLNGEAHYMVDAGGRVFRIIHRGRLALHAGRSMWDGQMDLDNCSIGIEVVGCHNEDITAAQYDALRNLLAQLKRIYRVPDERVLPHSMVAYGRPNRWHPYSHRGRKRCGMLFATPAVRQKLGLLKRPLFDPDVRAGRLKVGDPYLAKVLYGDEQEQRQAIARFAGGEANVIAPGRTAWDIARERYASADTIYVLPGGKQLRGSDISDWTKLPAGTRVVESDAQRDNESEAARAIGADTGGAADVAGTEAAAATTIYFLPDGRVRRGDELTAAELGALPKGTRVLVGYVSGGTITARRSAFDVCGQRWNYPSTFYRLADGRLVPGDKVDEKAIPRGTQVFFQK